MNVKQYLSQIERYDKNINNKLSELYQLKSMVGSIKTVMGGCSKINGKKDPLGNAVAKIVDTENSIYREIEKYIALRKKIVTQINGLDNMLHYQILYAKYVEYKTFERIAEEINYSWRQTIRLHGMALIEFEKMYNDEIMSWNVI